jgi:membrane protein
MKLPGSGVIQSVERTAARARVPMTRNLSVSRFVARIRDQALEDSLDIYAASLAYRGLFATFLSVVFLISLLGIFHRTDLVAQILERISLAMPEPVADLIREPLPDRGGDDPVRGAFTLGAVLSILGALWGISSAFRSLMTAMNVMYKVPERRPIWKRYAISFWLAAAVVALMLMAVVLVIAGGHLGRLVASAVGLGEVFALAWTVAQWPILIFFVLLAFALVYYYAPDAEQSFRFITPGSLIGLALWLAFSLLFLAFVNGFGVFNRIYGAIAGVAIHMLYMYYFSYILLLGAEINQVIEEHSPGGKKAGEKAPGEEAPAGSAAG